ncbi:hypothetical protein EV368DRAFT_65565 [Lentinula lateritia]|uniref:Uncharacterized protein n=1 Tax=Lentinula aff. lateritia TaxID=2804960 RepID=A0ACC1TYK8_9AGAR|nr:hypothetical protein F5876DRAFT_66267 [Lentinula aff. lateritia]KAJ3851672.1 hypothetical protein EV368DRAFT_65565 [Lentinula lateritia]
MRLVTSLVFFLGFVSLASAAPLDSRRPSSHIDITIAFEENPLEGIHTHLTQTYTEAVKEDVRTLVKSIAGRDLGAPEGSALLFHWIGTPSPDTAKPVMFDISTKKHGRYMVIHWGAKSGKKEILIGTHNLWVLEPLSTNRSTSERLA